MLKKQQTVDSASCQPRVLQHLDEPVFVIVRYFWYVVLKVVLDLIQHRLLLPSAEPL